MTAPTIYDAGALGLFRTADNPGVWAGRGKVAAVGIGHSPTLRRWDGDPQKSIGAWVILAIRKAIEDAGVEPSQVDGLVLDPSTTTGAFWPEGEPVPADFLAAFENTSDPFDGLTKLSAEWLVKNLPELTGLKFAMTAPTCMSMAVAAAVESIARGMGEVVIAIKGWHNIPGRYGQRGAAAQDTVSGPGKYGNSLAGPPVYGTAMMFERYMHKYSKTHEMMAPFVVNSRANGLKFPEGYWYQHRPAPLTTEEYLESRWVAEPGQPVRQRHPDPHRGRLPVHHLRARPGPAPAAGIRPGSRQWRADHRQRRLHRFQVAQHGGHPGGVAGVGEAHRRPAV